MAKEMEKASMENDKGFNKPLDWLVRCSDDVKEALRTMPISSGELSSCQYQLSLKVLSSKNKYEYVLLLKLRSKRPELLPKELTVSLSENGASLPQMSSGQIGPVFSMVHNDYVSSFDYNIKEENVFSLYTQDETLYISGRAITIDRNDELALCQLKEELAPQRLTEDQKAVLLKEKERQESERRAREEREAAERAQREQEEQERKAKEKEAEEKAKRLKERLEKLKKEREEEEKEREEKEKKITRDKAKKLVKAIWTEFHSREDVDSFSKRYFTIWIENNTHVLYGYDHKPIWGKNWRETILVLGENQYDIADQLRLLVERRILYDYEEISWLEPKNSHKGFKLSLNSYSGFAGEYCPMAVYSLQELYDIIDGKTDDYSLYKMKRDNYAIASQSPSNSVNQKTNGCYIATCVYGSYDCPEVWTLRRYRDQVLRNNWAGRVFIKIYYAVSPKVVALFGQMRVFQQLNRSVLDKWVKSLNQRGFGDSLYHDI